MALGPFKGMLGDPSAYYVTKNNYLVRWHSSGIGVLIEGDEKDGYYIVGIFEWRDRLARDRWQSEVIRILRKQVEKMR